MITIDDRKAFQEDRAATVERTLELARECLRAPGAGTVTPDLVSAALVHHLLPHLESDARLATAIPGLQGASLGTQLTGQRRELGSLVEGLDRVLTDAVRPSRRRLERALKSVIELLQRHVVTERELWAGLTAPGPSKETLSTLVREVELAERRAERSLRFVWQPPVSPTAAKALWWTSPSTWRVVVLDAKAAAGVRDHAGDGDQKEAL